VSNGDATDSVSTIWMSPYCTTLHQPLDSSKNRGGRTSRAAGFENLIRIACRNRSLNGAACLHDSFVSFIRESDSGIPSANGALLLRFIYHTQIYTHPVGLIWTSDQLVADAANYTTHNKHEHSFLQRDSNTRSQHSSCRRPTSSTAWPRGWSNIYIT
jgi:hypothetical protein